MVLDLHECFSMGEKSMTMGKKRIESFYDDYRYGTDHRCLIKAGAMPQLEILTCAGETNIDLIIMGSHTKEKPGKWHPGITVERVAYRAACPAVVGPGPRGPGQGGPSRSADEGERKGRLIRVFSGT